MLLEEAGILSQLRKGILPRPCQSPSNAQFVLRDGGAIQADKKRERRHCEPETKPDHFPSSTRCREAIRSTKAARAYHAQTLALMKRRAAGGEPRPLRRVAEGEELETNILLVSPRKLLPSAWGECGTNVEDAWPSATLRSWLTRYLALHRGQSGIQRCYHLRPPSDGCGPMSRSATATSLKVDSVHSPKSARPPKSK